MASGIPGEAIRIFLLCTVWFTVSSTNNVITKRLLNKFPHPVTVAFVQVFSTALFMGPTLVLWRVPKYSAIPKTTFYKFIVPLSFGKALAAVSAYVSIWKVPVSYAHTVKATMPIFTVVLSRLILGQKQTPLVYFSLAPIVLGVMVSTATELSFDIVGLMSALLATLTFAVQNIFTKKMMRELHISHLRLLSILARIATVILLPIWALYDLRKILTYSDLSEENILWLLVVITINGFLNFVQNMVAFTVLSLITPLSYSVATASKRILVISVSLFMLRNPVTIYNFLGMLMAIFGVFIYNKAKYDANRAAHHLPMHNKDTKLPTPSLTNGHLNHINSHVHDRRPHYHLI
ncbi:solute carrier family 35 member E1 [Nematostella vectensis]|uniref:solute carrier family 35 member E1 n=1 Tax=Nematostella vectensis TaxID=45351 RepID=UPI002077769E|nr:solute carrier family 35 member E1 [Nematostella vectensis]